MVEVCSKKLLEAVKTLNVVINVPVTLMFHHFD